MLGVVLLSGLIMAWIFVKRAVSGSRLGENPSYFVSLLLTLVSFAYFYFPTEIHERYSLYLVMPLILSALLAPAPRASELWASWLAGLLILLNLVYLTPFFEWSSGQRDVYGEWVGRGAAIGLLFVAVWCIIKLLPLVRHSNS
jgi:hypothetical protein